MPLGGGFRIGICCPSHPLYPMIAHYDYRSSDQICTECGVVVKDRVDDVGSEWRTFSYEAGNVDPSQIGEEENTLLDGSNLTTIFGPSTSGGGSLINESGEALGRKKKRQTMSSSDQTLVSAYNEISNMAVNINLPRTVVDRANCLFKNVHDGKHLKGHSTKAIASTCLYIACRQEGVPRTFKEICALTKIDKKELGRCYKLIPKALETSVDVIPRITTSDFIPRFCSNLGMQLTKVIFLNVSLHIGLKAVELDVVPGRSPLSVAAAAIYMASLASEKKLTKKAIGDITGVADVTIRQLHELMYPRAAELFPPEFNLIISKLSQG
ncbi:hypothetical protein DAPPUDRAFT_50412 [Daphnia pulex]|uniref:Transcription initiation factor IIB n=1 Tax=Daphnia pulex TaxID=6669 RepID=E9GGS8_DAPPU|nr:hypothetical protein DAPPUDRAFT_50412 [Daphnia pulex]|eukprot:EFX81075.1 hypothetical protein DAPPUDRAFT_50412 [Daphnia pulex]